MFVKADPAPSVTFVKAWSGLRDRSAVSARGRCLSSYESDTARRPAARPKQRKSWKRAPRVGGLKVTQGHKDGGRNGDRLPRLGQGLTRRWARVAWFWFWPREQVLRTAQAYKLCRLLNRGIQASNDRYNGQGLP